jgi:hypothetical protein
MLSSYSVGEEELKGNGSLTKLTRGVRLWRKPILLKEC